MLDVIMDIDMTPVQKAWMDWAGYTDLLRALRFGDQSGWSEEALAYFQKKYKLECHKYSYEQLTVMSKSVGWQKLTCGPRETFIPEEWAKWKNGSLVCRVICMR
jgi:hypothetical protein